MTIGDYLQEMGVAIRGSRSWSKVRCPFHDDRTPSATVNIREDRFKCFVCGISEDLIGLIMLREGVTYAEAKQQVEENSGEGDSPVRSQPELGDLLPGRKRNRTRNGDLRTTWRGVIA